MAKILITEKVQEIGPKMLTDAGHEIVYADRDMDVIKREIVDADAVFVRIIDLTPELLSTAKNLKMVSKHGVGLDNIPVEWCKEHGIVVTMTPNANSQSVAEHAFALMMTLAKNVIPVSNAYKEIGFAAKNSKEGVEVTGKTVGIIGLGNIGKRFAKMCYGGFDMKVLAYDPYVKEAPEGVTLVEDLDSMLREADIVSLHAMLTDETRKMMNAERIGQMKPTAILINCARGPIVDEPALIDALENGRLAAAGLDVTDPEPVDPESKLFKMKNVIVTPHYAPTTLESAMRVSEIGCSNILACLDGKGEMVGRVA
ncbi:MAG: hydroxyacid dehydrogenase [Lachnospiraceae bacterium]|nr:hydroxyacid dehydrogenase [Lachnospiraceae bacterium]